MQGDRLSTSFLLILFLAACAGSGSGGSAEGGVADSSAAAGARAAPVVAFRLPVGGGPLRIYALRTLQESPFSGRGRVSPSRAAVGMDIIGRRLLYRDSAGATVSFDLVANHERAVAPAGALASLASDGTLLAVDAAGTVTESQPWGVRRWSGGLGRGINDAFAAPGARLLTIRRGSTDSLQIASHEAGVSVAAPRATAAAASRDGDAVAFATDSGVVVIEDREAQHPWFVRLSGTPRAVAFSPSGHRIYVALGGKSELAVVDRFSRGERPAVALPAPAAALRIDPWGRAVLVRPAAGEETYVIGTAGDRVTGRLNTPWASDLPVISEDGLLLAREGDAVITRDLRSLDSLGAVPDGAGDLWFVGRWAVTSAASAIRRDVRAADTTHARESPRPAPAASNLWVQVSNTQNEQWAHALASELTAAGHPAEVVPPGAAGEGWRVLMGPYRSHDAADSAGRSLGRPYWILERPRADGPP